MEEITMLSSPSHFGAVRSQETEKLLYQFDEAWLAGTVPAIEEYVKRHTATKEGHDAADRRKFLEELVKIDLEYRWRRKPGGGKPWSLEDYVARYPELGRLDSLALDLIAAEYRVRQRWGDRPAQAEYAARFKGHGTQLHVALAQIGAQLAAEFASQGVSPPEMSAGLPAMRVEQSLFKSVGLQEVVRPIASVGDLLDTIRQYQLLGSQQLGQLTSERWSQRFPEARQLAKQLVQRDWLTAYQINQLFLGRGPELVLGPYVLLERLGEGGTGQVFKARHQGMQRTVALKVLRRELLTDAEVVGRFYREVQVISKLDNPHVVHAYDAGPIGATHFLAMEFVEGTDLARLVKRGGPLPVPQACEYIRQAALGLQYAHQQGLVHRDIKPHNLLLSTKDEGQRTKDEGQRTKPESNQAFVLRTSSFGLVKILDLGLARLRPAGEATSEFTEKYASSLTPVGAVMLGTADYLAPEQALDFHRADIRSDIYSLGCTFYYLLTGQPPYPGGNLAQKVAKHLHAAAPAVEQVRLEVPAPVAAVVGKMLAKRPEDRYQTPAEVATALAPLCARLPGPGFFQRLGWPGPRLRLAPLLRRRKLLGTVVGVILASLIVSLIVLLRPSPAAAGLKKLRAQSKLAKRDIDEVWLRGDIIQFRMEYPGTPEAREAAEMLMRLPSPMDQLEPNKIPAEKRPARPPKELVAVFGEIRGNPGDRSALAISPDGNLVAGAWAGENVIHLWDSATGNERTVLKGHQQKITCLVFSPDAKTIASVSADYTFKLWDVAKGSEQVAQRLEGGISCLAFSPDGKTLALGQHGQCKLWDIPNKKDKRALKVTAHALGIAPDGETLAVVDTDSLKLFHLATGRERRRLPMTTNHITFSFAPDSKTIAVTSFGAPLQLWDAISGQELRSIKEEGDYKWLVAFLPDGKSLLRVRPQEAVLYDAALEKTIKQWTWDLPEIGRAILAPDGRHLLLGSSNGAVYVLRLFTGAAPGS
jgi:serine/threonine-protein kinase